MVSSARFGTANIAAVIRKPIPEAGGARASNSVSADPYDARRTIESGLSVLKKEVNTLTWPTGRCRAAS